MSPPNQIVKGVEIPPPHPKHLIIFFLLGTLFGASLFYEPKKPTTYSPAPATAEQLDRIHDAIVQLQASKCMTISTQGITIYHTPNLGVVKVPPYDKSAGKGKGKADVRDVREAAVGPEVPHGAN